MISECKMCHSLDPPHGSINVDLDQILEDCLCSWQRFSTNMWSIFEWVFPLPVLPRSCRVYRKQQLDSHVSTYFPERQWPFCSNSVFSNAYCVLETWKKCFINKGFFLSNISRSQRSSRKTRHLPCMWSTLVSFQHHIGFPEYCQK